MMLKRVDVSLEGFLWGENVIGKEGEIVAAIQSQRQQLSEIPYRYSINDALYAPKNLLVEFTRSVSTGHTTSASTRKSLVKTLIIGSVPDRGGRVDVNINNRNTSSSSNSNSSSKYNSSNSNKQNQNHNQRNQNHGHKQNNKGNKDGNKEYRSSSAPNNNNSNNKSNNNNNNNNGPSHVLVHEIYCAVS